MNNLLSLSSSSWDVSKHLKNFFHEVGILNKINFKINDVGNLNKINFKINKSGNLNKINFKL